MGTCFNRIHYDPFKKKIYLWETIDGKRYSDVIDNVFEYYVEDESGKSDITDVYGKKVVKRISKTNQAIRMLKESGEFCCETDIPQDVKFLHKRYEGQELKPDIKEYNICYIDIEVESSEEEFPHAHIAKYPINLITIKLSRTKQTYTWALGRPYTGDKKFNYKHFATEKEMLENFIAFFIKAKVDIITGWNSSGAGGFDIPYIINRCNRLGIEACLSPVGKYWKNENTGEWSIPGIALLDYMRFYKDMKFVQTKMEQYNLDFICKYELKKGKLHYEGSIHNFYRDDWNKFVEYNIVDTELVEELDNVKKFIELAINICHNSLIPFDKVFSAVSVIEGQILVDLHKNNMVMNDKKEGVLGETLPGAWVESQMDYFENVITYDVESEYPNMMLHYNVSPECIVLYPENKEDFISTPLSESHGIYYRKEKGFLTKIVEKNFAERRHFKDLQKKAAAEGDKDLESYYKSQQAIRKVFLNSIYGVLANEWFHYYNINMAKTVTLSGQHLIKHLRDRINEYFNNHFYRNTKFFSVVDEKNKTNRNRIVNLDTDSLFIDFSDIKKMVAPDEPLLSWANKLDEQLMKPFFKSVLDKYFAGFGVKNGINFKIEKICTQMIMFGDGGKIYAMKMVSDEGKVYDPPMLKISGFASQRSSTPPFCRTQIEKVMNEFFDNISKDFIVKRIKEIKKLFSEQEIDDIASSKKVSDYNKYAPRETSYYITHGLEFVPRTPMHNRAAMVYNVCIEKYKLPLEPITGGTKIKFIYVVPNNEFRQDVVGFVGTMPNELKDKFRIDFNQQFQVYFINPMQALFDVMRWGQIDIETENINNFFEW